MTNCTIIGEVEGIWGVNLGKRPSCTGIVGTLCPVCAQFRLYNKQLNQLWKSSITTERFDYSVSSSALWRLSLLMETGLEDETNVFESLHLASPPELPQLAPTAAGQTKVKLALQQHARDMLGLFGSSARAEREAREALEGERAAAVEALAAERAAGAAASVCLAHLQESISRMGLLLSRNVRWRLDLRAAEAAWHQWRGRCTWKHRLEEGMGIADKHYRVGRLQRSVLCGWRDTARQGLRERYRALLTASAEAEVRAAAAASASQDLQARLAVTEADLQAAHAKAAALGEDMKRALLRGVCALNIEALSVMKRAGSGGESGAPPLSDVSNMEVLAAATPAAEQGPATEQEPVLDPHLRLDQGWLSSTLPAPAAHPSSLPPQHLAPCQPAVPAEHLLPKPPAQAAHPLVRVVPAAGERLSIVSPPGGGRTAVRAAAKGYVLRGNPHAAMPSKLPSNITAEIAERFGGGGRVPPGSPSSFGSGHSLHRPATAPALQQHQMVSARSLAAQQCRSKPVVVRGSAVSTQQRS